MAITFEQIAQQVFVRRSLQTPLLRKMIQIRDRYNGDVVIPVPNAPDEVSLPPLTPTIIANAVDIPAMRAASTQPAIYCPAVDPTKEEGRRSVEYADTRRKGLAYTYSESYWPLASRRLFRHLAAYATGAVVVTPDFKRGCIRILVRDPLSCYPEPKAPEDLTPVCNAAFVYRKSTEWLDYTFPGALNALKMRNGISRVDTRLWDICEWIDDDVIVYGILGPAWPWSGHNPDDPLRWTAELPGGRFDNKAGCCSAYVPRRVTLDQIATQVANQVGVADLMSRLLELDIRATEKSIYPDKYVLAKMGQAPKLVSGGKWKSGYTGDINLIVDADSVGQLHSTPDPHASQAIDRLERNFNVSAGIGAQQVGESYGALRTGRGIDSLMGASVDPRIQELHEIMEIVMTHTNEIVLDAYKGYFGSKSFSVWSGWASDKGQVNFTPNEHFEIHDNNVAYPMPGADVQTITIELGQLYGAEAISLSTFRSMHPYISDAEEEADQRLVEDLDKLALQSLAQKAQRGEIVEQDLMNMKRAILDGKTLEQAIDIAQRGAQERQAAMAPPPGPGMGAAPETMPGMANPGMGAEQMPPDIPQPPGGLDNFRQLVRAMRSPNAGVGVNAPGGGGGQG